MSDVRGIVNTVGIVCTLTNVCTCRAISNYSYWLWFIGRIYLYTWLLSRTFNACFVKLSQREYNSWWL